RGQGFVGGHIVRIDAGVVRGNVAAGRNGIEPIAESPLLLFETRYGLDAIAAGGYVAAHHAGVYADYMPAYEALAAENALPVRV
ncbi:MAG: hypothetical protein AAGE43_15065, partial [Pseudomonadota bacterium]